MEIEISDSDEPEILEVEVAQLAIEKATIAADIIGLQAVNSAASVISANENEIEEIKKWLENQQLTISEIQTNWVLTEGLIRELEISIAQLKTEMSEMREQNIQSQQLIQAPLEPSPLLEKSEDENPEPEPAQKRKKHRLI